MLVLDHLASPPASGAHHGADNKLLDDFFERGLADEQQDSAAVAKLAEVLGCDPARLRIQWSRVTDAAQEGEGVPEGSAEGAGDERAEAASRTSSGDDIRIYGGGGGGGGRSSSGDPSYESDGDGVSNYREE